MCHSKYYGSGNNVQHVCAVLIHRTCGYCNRFQNAFDTRVGLPDNTEVDTCSDFGAEFHAFTIVTGVHHHVAPLEAPWHNGMVERHGQHMARTMHAVCTEPTVVGPEQVIHV